MNINKWLLCNSAAVLAVFVFGAATVSLENSFVWLHNIFDMPTGARLGMLLIFGLICFPGTLVGSLLVGVAFIEPGESINVKVLEESAGAFSALIALLMMHYFKLSNFYTKESFYYPHVLFLCILTALLSATSRLIVLVQFDQIDKDFNYSEYIGSVLLSNLFGTLVFFTLAIFIMQAFRQYFMQHTAD